MRTRRTFIAALACAAFLGLVRPAPAEANFAQGAETFIASLADQAVQSLTVKGIDRGERVARFRAMFNDRFAVRSIGRWVLGKFWRKATDDEKVEYQKLFEDLMVASYVDRFANYAGEKLEITKTIDKDGKTATVFSRIMRDGAGDPISVNWRVGGKNGVYKVADVVVEGTSMSATLRSEFASIIKQRGGTVAGLLEALREKTASLQTK